MRFTPFLTLAQLKVHPFWSEAATTSQTEGKTAFKVSSHADVYLMCSGKKYRIFLWYYFIIILLLLVYYAITLISQSINIKPHN